MANYIPYHRGQTAMVVVNFTDQIQPGTFEYAVDYLVEHKLDLSEFAAVRKNDASGRPAYDPAILLKIILYAYSKGMTTSREIAWCCRTNIVFMALACESMPHYTTIGGFISGYPKAIEALFEQVLLVCDEEGLLGKELFAIDGCKLPSNAAKTWSGTHQELRDKRAKLKRLIQHHMEEHQRHDRQSQDESEQQARHQQSIETLSKAADKIDRFLNDNVPRMGQGQRPQEVKSNITDNDSAKMTTSKGTIQGYNGIASVDKKHQIVIDAQAFGGGQEQPTLQPVLKTIKERFKRLEISQDIYADGTIMTADTGFANEQNMEYLYKENINGYIPDNQFRSRDPKFSDQKIKHPKPSKANPNAQHRIPASEFGFDPTQLSCQCPAGHELRYRGTGEDKQGNNKVFFEGLLGQCRPCRLKSQCLKNPTSADHSKGRGRQVSFILSKNREPNYTDWMKQRVDSDKGKQIYSHRMSVVEPVFGNLSVNKKLRRFSLRGNTKVNAQWRLYCLVQNIEKLAHYGNLDKS